MKKVYVYCEGQTEESFVNNILLPAFFPDYYFRSIICTSSNRNERKYAGGVVTYGKIKKELQRICGEHKHEIVTTMIDYYGLPQDTPGIDCSETDIYKKISIIENSINEDIGWTNFHCNLMLHEFETLLFSDPDVFINDFGDEIANQINEIRSSFENPEYINNSTQTAPSKRLLRIIPNYSKVRNGTILSQKIGIDKMRKECPHFDNWLKSLTTY